MVTSASATASYICCASRLSGSCTAATEEAASECWLTAQPLSPPDARDSSTRAPISTHRVPGVRPARVR